MSDVNKTVDALAGYVNVPPKISMPEWLEGTAPVGNLKELVAFPNGLLDVPGRRVLMHTPRFWSPNALDFDYDPMAKAPRFERFLEEVLPGDRDAQQRLLELFGLCVTDETKYQKAFMFVGPPRGGRGTIGRVLKGLIGEANYLGTSLRAFSEDFGMAGFIGKKVVVFSDANLDGMSLKNLAQITERVKQITGEDPTSVRRKYLGEWEGVLTARLIVFANELLRFKDDSGALAGRVISWQMTEQFKGARQDPDLTSKLLAERPGILNLSLAALDQLRARGRFLQPESGIAMSEELAELTSDVKLFVVERCIVRQGEWALLDGLFQSWEAWCMRKGIRHAIHTNALSPGIKAAAPTVRSNRPRKLPNGTPNPTRLTVFYGIGMRK